MLERVVGLEPGSYHNYISRQLGEWDQKMEMCGEMVERVDMRLGNRSWEAGLIQQPYYKEPRRGMEIGLLLVNSSVEGYAMGRGNQMAIQQRCQNDMDEGKGEVIKGKMVWLKVDKMVLSDKSGVSDRNGH